MIYLMYKGDDKIFFSLIVCRETPRTSENQVIQEVRIDEKTEPKITRRRRRKRGNLPIALQGLMGEANMRFARGDLETAEKMCFKIVTYVELLFAP